MNNKNTNSKLFKWLTLILLLIILSLGSIYYVNYNYTKTIDKFYSEFSKCDFNNAKNTLKSDNLVLTLKKKALNNDLTNYFTSVIAQLCIQIKNDNTKTYDAVTVFKEMKTYDVLNTSLDKLILSLDTNYTPDNSSSFQSILDLGIQKYNNKDYSGSVALLNKIPMSEDKYYTTAQQYITKCADDYKLSLLKEADDLASDDYYTKAIDLLSKADTTIINVNDEAIASKIAYLQAAREGYLASLSTSDSESESTSTSIIQNLNTSNINTLNIESQTQFLIYVNLAEQKTYVYEGSANNWTLEKNYDCSTGISGEDTPKGVFSVTDRGDWFFSKDYGQGGKYWVQFMGDYLFHSLPFDETATEVLDYTLGEPASHGCIRLNTEEAKWIYDNVTDNTKVIIN